MSFLWLIYLVTSIFCTIVSEVSNALSCSDRQFNMVHIGRVLICALLVCAMLFSFTQSPVAHAEAITVTIAVIGSILALIAASYGLTVTYGSVDAAVQSFWAAEAQDFISRSPVWTIESLGLMGVAWLATRLENPSLLLDDMTVSFCNDFFYDWCNTKYNIPENVSTPTGIGIYLSELQFYDATTPQQNYTYLEDALAAAGAPLEIIPYDDDTLNVQQGAGNPLNIYYNGNLILSNSSYSSRGLALYFYFYAHNAQRLIYVLCQTSTRYHWYANDISSITSYANDIEASIPEDYTEQTVPQVDYGTALTYTGAPDTTYEDFLDTGIEEILLDAYDPTLTEDIPWDEPIPTPATDTTWEDGALGFWQAVGGAITGGLTTAGQSVRQWIQSMHAQMVQYWEALLEWCDGIVGAIEGAEDGFIRGIINEITTVFGNAKNTIRSALGIWHYVVEWVQSITTPFSLFLGLAGRVSPYLTLPIYASLAGLVILGVYKKFIG